MPKTSTIPDEPPIGVATLARRYSLKPATIREWFRSGVLAGRNERGRWSTSWDAVFAFEGAPGSSRREARDRAKQPLITVETIAARHERTTDTVRGWLRRNRISGIKIMGEWYADASALRDFEDRLRP